MDILTEANFCRQVKLIIWTSFIGQFVNSVGGDWVYCLYSQLRVSLYENLVQYPIINISIVRKK